MKTAGVLPADGVRCNLMERIRVKVMLLNLT